MAANTCGLSDGYRFRFNKRTVVARSTAGKVAWCAALLWLVCGTAQFVSATVEMGDSYDEVTAKLGRPKGEMYAGETRVVLLYERGLVTLQDGKVVFSNILSPQKWLIRKERQQEEIRVMRATAARSRLERIEKGKAEKKTRRNDAKFDALPAKERLAYWRTFAKRYPEVSVETEIANAQAQVKAAAQALVAKDLASLKEQIQAKEAELQDLAEKVHNAQTSAYMKRCIRRRKVVTGELEKLRQQVRAAENPES